MRIALVGYGKMGRAIEEIAQIKKDEIVLKISSSNREELTAENLKSVDVAIEFSKPENAFENITTCLNAGIPVVSGTTAWLDKLDEAKKICNDNNTAFLYASNFSIGVNLFFELNKTLAHLMANREYAIEMEEIHHTAKQDAPSGTAITLAEDILRIHPQKEKWVNQRSENEIDLSILSTREDPAPGTHRITYYSDIDELEIKHTAKNRKGFAQGALSAARFICGKKGFFTMKDVLNL